MKRAAKILFVAITFFFIQSCDRRDCTNVTCQAYETCFQGACYCADGYEGADCSTESYQKYIGSYNVNETCPANGSSNFFQYSAYIQPTGYPNRIQFTGLFGMGVSADAIIYNTAGGVQGSYFEIPTQQQGAMTYSGQGNFDVYNNIITVNFNYTWNGASYQCTHTFYKF